MESVAKGCLERWDDGLKSQGLLDTSWNKLEIMVMDGL